MDFNQQDSHTNSTKNNSSEVSNDTIIVYHGYDCLPVSLCNFIIVVYILIFVIALMSNVAICYVILCKKSMHTTTNCYLFNLSMSDLILLIFGITSQIEIVISPAKFFSRGVTCLISNLAKEITMNVSVLTITAFTVERYFAICYPFLARVMSKTSRVIKLLIVIWIIAALSSLPYVDEYSLVTKSGATHCKFNKTAISFSLEITMMVVFFIVPMVIMTVVHVLIGMTLSKITKSKGKRPSVIQASLRMATSVKKTSRILVVIATTFFLCWAPLRIQRLLSTYLNSINYNVAVHLDTLYCVLYLFSNVLVLLSTFMNPLIFSIMSSKFRNAFKDLSHETYEKVRGNTRCTTKKIIVYSEKCKPEIEY